MRIRILLLALAALAFGTRLRAADPTAPQIDFFEKTIRPILVNNCYACHSADTKPAGNLRVDDRAGIFRGGQSGPAVVPGNPAKSVLIQRVSNHDPKKRMPKEGQPLSDQQIADLTAWIRDGAAWPVEKVSLQSAASSAMYQRLREHHWSLQPLGQPPVPQVSDTAWPANEVDRFILSKLEQRNLKPVADASRLALIRRVAYDLTGLPPTPDEIHAFPSDNSPDAFSRVVDRLLAAPQFGERWGRHWLDVARYGESSGPSRNIPYPQAWRYRDYVIDAVNRDVPYNRFLTEQIAGDLLPATTPAERDRLLVATGFLALGPKDVNQRFEERFVMDNAAEQIDTVTRSVLAYTVGCARCHDHKFDPIPTADYYALAGIFTSTEMAVGVRSKMGGSGLDYYDPDRLLRLSTYQPVPHTEAVARLEAEIAAAKKEWQAIVNTPEGQAPGPDGRPRERPYRVKLRHLQAELLELTDPGWHGYVVHGVRESKQIGDTAIRIRGEAERQGPVVPRGFLSAVNVPDAPKIEPGHSGRLELAEWLTNPANPLTPRVIVNRVWAHLFGQGIVSTVDNFGSTGDAPSHPELLDYLANRFIDDGWSVKKLVRTLMLSHAYRLGSDFPAAYHDIDPSNRLVWRHSPRRLDTEEIRDAILASSGGLDLRPASGSPVQRMKMVEIRDNGPEAAAILDEANHSNARSIYLPQLRGVTPLALAAFDPVTQTLVTGQREATTVPTQALFMLNSGFVRSRALALADSLLSRRENDRARIREAYWRILNREPERAEIDRAARFLAQIGHQTLLHPAAAETTPKQPFQFGVDTDDMDRADQTPPEIAAQPANAPSAAWMTFVQALYASAEFRFVR